MKFTKLIAPCLFLLLLSFSASAQQTSTGLSTDPDKLPQIDAAVLTGSWTAIDSLESTIEFVDIGHSLEILPKQLTRGYTFSKDSSGTVQAIGYAANWPPLYCQLVLIDGTILEITYFAFDYTGTPLYYRKTE